MPHGPFARALSATVRLPRHEGGYLAQGSQLGGALDAVLDGVRYSGPVQGVRGIVAPHIDLHRGWEGYGHAYGALHHSGDVFDVYVILGTVHEGVRSPFVLTNHTFRTQFGDLRVDESAGALHRACGDWVLREAQAHEDEHSIEFQTVFLAHHAARSGRPMPTIIPILCGYPLRQGQMSVEATRFLTALSRVLQEYGSRVCVVAAVDLAHMGPQFGDAQPMDAGALGALREQDIATLRWVEALDPVGFWNDVCRGGNPRRICGLTPLYAFLNLLRKQCSQGHVVHYDQALDSSGNVVSYASAILTA
jgi:MEMO1 family protein